MIEIMLFLHVLGAVAVGFYLLLPFLSLRIAGLAGQAQEGYMGGLFFANRIGQYLLILQLVTGGYLLHSGGYSTAWTVAVLVLFVLMAALAGMIAGPFKRGMRSIREGGSASRELPRIQLFSWIIWVSLLALIILMNFPSLF